MRSLVPLSLTVTVMAFNCGCRDKPLQNSSIQKSGTEYPSNQKFEGYWTGSQVKSAWGYADLSINLRNNGTFEYIASFGENGSSTMAAFGSVVPIDASKANLMFEQMTVTKNNKKIQEQSFLDHKITGHINICDFNKLTLELDGESYELLSTSE